MKAALTGQVLIRKGKIWTAKLRIGLVAIFQASAPRIFSAAAEDSAAAIASVAVEDLGVIALEVAASVVVDALAASAAAVGADAEN